MDNIEMLGNLSKEIKALDEKITMSDTVQKSDVKALIERLEVLGKEMSKYAIVEKDLDTNNVMNFWKTEKQALGFCDYLADGPLSQFAKNHSQNDLFKNMKKSVDGQSVGTNADGGYLAPTEYASYLIDRGLTYGQTLPLFPRQKVNGKAFDIATNDTDNAALFAVAGGGTTSEEHTKLVAKMVFNHVTLTPKTLYAVRFATNKLLRQSRFAIANLVGGDLAKSINKRMTYCAWLADGTDDATNGAITGVRSKSGIGEVNLTTADQLYTTSTSGSPASSDATVKGMDAIVKCMNQATGRAYQSDTAWFMHRVTLNNLYAVKDSTGNPIIRDAFVAGYGLTPTLRGYPVRTDEIFDHADSGSSSGDMLVAFGSPSQGGMFGYNEDVAISFSEHERWLLNQSGWKAEIEIDFQVTDVGAWSRIVV